MPVIARAVVPPSIVRGITPRPPTAPRPPRLHVLLAAQHLRPQSTARSTAQSTAPAAMPSAPPSWRVQIEQGRRTPLAPQRLLPALSQGSNLLARRAALASARHVDRLAQMRQSALQTPRPPDRPKSLASRPVTVQPLPRDVLTQYLSNAANRQRFECAAHSGQLLHRDVSSDKDLVPAGYFGVYSEEAKPALRILNWFTPDKWILEVPNEEAFIPIIDVVMTQFEQAATDGDFQTSRPATLLFNLEESSLSASELPASPLVTGLLSLLDMEIATTRSTRDGVELCLRPRPNSQADFLARYLQDAKHAEARCVIREQLNTGRFAGNWNNKPGGWYCTSTALVSRNPDRFLNAFSPTEWRMMSNYRSPLGPAYYASDAVLAQYDFVSKRHGFYGQLPERIVRASICNETTLAVLAEHGSDLQAFLTQTPNGKHTARMLEALGLKALSLQWDPKARDATVHLQTRADTDLGARPKNS